MIGKFFKRVTGNALQDVFSGLIGYDAAARYEVRVQVPPKDLSFIRGAMKKREKGTPILDAYNAFGEMISTPEGELALERFLKKQDPKRQDWDSHDAREVFIQEHVRNAMRNQ